MSTTAYLTLNDSAEPSFLQFAMWSIFVHLGMVALFSMIQLGKDFEEPSPLVNVRLVKIPVNEPAAEAIPGEFPPFMTARRPAASAEQTIFPPPTLAPTAATPMTLAHVASPTALPDKAPHVTYQVLQDHRAIDSLKLKNYLKTVQRTTTQPTTSTTIRTPSGMPALPPTMAARIPSITTIPRTSPPPIFSQSAQTPILTATPPGSNGIAKSRVGLEKTIPPVYPRIARESGWEGTVVVRLVIQADGSPEVIQIRKSSGHQVLDDAALNALKNWQFVPAKDGNIPVRSIVDIPINFDLRKQE